MHIQETFNAKGEKRLILSCSGKDPLTKKYKVYNKTYPVPENIIGKKALDQFKLKCQIDWAEKVKQQTSGIFKIDKDICFCDYAEKWVEKILIKNNESYNYYTHCKNNLHFFHERFGRLTLKEMTLPVIQKFCEWLNTRTYKQEIAVVRKGLKLYLDGIKMSQVKASKVCGISIDTLKNATVEDRHLSIESANKICSALNISFGEYFRKQSEERQYSVAANRGLKTFLHCVLGQAVKEGYIEINYASREYTDKICGTKKSKEIYNRDEATQFLKYLDNCNDLRKKVAFSIGLYLGLRGAEIMGLEWKDFDFDKSTINIERNTLYVYGFGTKTKSTKTDSSTRKITIPEKLKDLIIEYRYYWNEQKRLHGDLWVKTDRLFLQNNGKPMAGSTVQHWLKKFQEENNLKHVTIHGLRHTIATLMLINGIDIKTVAGRLGHNSITTTLSVYTHYVKEADQKASEVIGDILNVG